MVVTFIALRKGPNILLGSCKGGSGGNGVGDHYLLFLNRVLSGLVPLLIPKLLFVVSPPLLFGRGGYNALTNSLVDKSVCQMLSTVEGARVGRYEHSLDLRG